MFGEFLISKKQITDENLAEALSVKPMVNKKIGRLLVELGFISQKNCDEHLTQYLEITKDPEFFNDVSDNSNLLEIKKIEVRGLCGFLVHKNFQKLYLKEFSDLLVEAAENYLKAGGLHLKTYILSDEQWSLIESLSKPVQEKSHSPIIDFNRPKAFLESSTPYKDLLLSLLKKAKELNASDVHFDSNAYGLDIRFRVNGDLTHAKFIKREHAQSFLTEVKAQTGLPLTVIGAPCSGAARFSTLKLKVRAQSNGQIYGETIVLRLIDEDKIKNASIASIGADLLFEQDLKKALSFNNGLILMCGQTGSGKSWTLYSILMSMDRESEKVITIEDPVEYEGSGLMQIEVSEGKTHFQEALKSSLRLDPDVIMIGEIRDEETAALAFKAAATGHLVLSTLHTNGAIEALARLKGLGIDEEMITSNVRMISALTLKKKLCKSCRLPLNADEVTEIYSDAGILAYEGDQFFKRNQEGCKSPGCYEGAVGRTLLYESINQNDIRMHYENLIVPGFRDLKQYALERAAQGEIGIEELLNV